VCNLIRFTGLSLGAALVAVVLSGGDHYGVLFLVCSAVLATSLMTTFVRRATVTRAVVAQ
jgi:hypothetical protein